MGLDIALYRGTDEESEEIISLNWLRNPFGLCNWAEDNFEHVEKKAGNTWSGFSLWDVCNQWSYDKSTEINRKIFKLVVDQYASTLLPLNTSYFFFDLPGYRQFIQRKELRLPGHDNFIGDFYAIDNSFYDDRQRLAIPVDHFKHPSFNLGECSTVRYQEWFKKLVEFGNLLQDETLRFYCSN